MFLGVLYHLKNPFYALEKLAHHSHFCFLSTRVARFSPNKAVRLDGLPVSYLLGPAECNNDSTNYWIFSPLGLERLVERAGWLVLGSVSTGSLDSDPRSSTADERMFLLLKAKG
jgi:hypothetical protein